MQDIDIRRLRASMLDYVTDPLVSEDITQKNIHAVSILTFLIKEVVSDRQISFFESIKGFLIAKQHITIRQYICIFSSVIDDPCLDGGYKSLFLINFKPVVSWRNYSISDVAEKDRAKHQYIRGHAEKNCYSLEDIREGKYYQVVVEEDIDEDYEEENYEEDEE